MLRPRAERQSLALDEILPVQIVLLLRAGEDKLAHQVWTAWAVGLPPEGVADAPRILCDPYPLLARDWLWALHQRALWARSHGDDALALASLRGLARAVPAVVAELGRRGAQEDLDSGALAEVQGMLPRLLADQERRAQAPGSAGAQAPGSAGGPPPALPGEPAARVAALIADLDEIRDPLIGRSPSRSLADDPRVQALVREGASERQPLGLHQGVAGDKPAAGEHQLACREDVLDAGRPLAGEVRGADRDEGVGDRVRGRHAARDCSRSAATSAAS